ncbi:leukocyte immunoglobulin-like receptor subfamily B member 4 isoform X2 [Peromyscus leucopus]|uniref:leukocyte immunoglobulin-like receptor subfamily B member 4 isoform X2 n=1 Tax=Peromyscus leucopus TaxID=10041 RepID=UPI0018854531|nr:leukocyte immunoglobulin-like receptor subfamily B member 4 isoform X2 [Peromyscus leucopus]
MTGRTCLQTENSLSDVSTEYGQAAPGAQARKIARLTMVPMLRMLLCLGLSVGQKTAVLAETLTKPKIWAEPHSVIAMYAPVTIWCQGSWDAKEYHLLKEGRTDLWDRQYPLESLDKAKFHIKQMTVDFAGIYKCNYKSPAGWSEHSDTLELVLTGAYHKPSLSVWPGPAVTLGETITMQCSSLLGFGTFSLIQEGKHHLQWILDSQQSANREFQAHFVLDPVTTIHNGTFRCYGCFRNRPQVWSKSSDSLHLLVSESKDQSPTHTENGLGRYQKVLIGVLVSLLLLFFLLILLILFRYQCKGKEKNADQRETNLQLLEGDTDPTARDRLPQKRSGPDAAIKEENQYASAMDPQPEETVELDSWNPSDEEPQRIVYAHVKPSRLHRAGSTSPSPLSGKVLDMKNNQSGENREMYSQVGSVHSSSTSCQCQAHTFLQLCPTPGYYIQGTAECDLCPVM